MARPPLLTLDDMQLTFGGQPLLEGASLAVAPRDRVCLVGRNGSGKSTLLKIAAGRVEADGGTRFVKPGTSWRYLPQEPDVSDYPNLRAYIEDGLVGADDAYRVPYLLDALGLTGDEVPGALSGGEIRRAALARTLAPEPDILMLDEPTNHLDLPAIQWLEGELGQSAAAIVLISHDRRFLEALSRRTVWLDRGKTRELDAGFGEFEDWRDTTIEQEELERHKAERKAVREQHWVVHGVSGRRKRNVRRLKELQTLRSDLAAQTRRQGVANVSVADAQTSGRLVAVVESVSKTFGARTVIDDFSIRIARGERIGVVGPNGSGKTTLIKLLMGELEPDSGTVKLGANLQPLVIDQSRPSLDPETSLADALTGGGTDGVQVGDKTVHVQSYMKDYLFRPEQRTTPLRKLSGGERARVQLAKGLRLPSNLLVLDEPTNDLDLETLDLLQEVVSDYDGTVVVVSHDRDFLDRTVGRTIAYEGNGQWQVYAGGYADMVAQRGRGVSRRERTKPREDASAPKPAEPALVSKTKLSYKHTHRLSKLPGEMAELESRISTLRTKLAVPDYFTSNAEGFNSDAKALASAQSDLAAREEEWLELEMLREAAENS